jgi:hypothetical protein
VGTRVLCSVVAVLQMVDHDFSVSCLYGFQATRGQFAFLANGVLGHGFLS